MYKIQWSNHSEEEATWETEESLRSNFPDCLPKEIVRNHAQPLLLPFESKFQKYDLNQNEVIMKQNLKGLPSEVAKRMTFEEQFALIIEHPIPVSLTLRFTPGGL
jgi:hypothetical protein